VFGTSPGLLKNTAQVMLTGMNDGQDDNGANDSDSRDVVIGGADLGLTINGPTEVEFVLEDPARVVPVTAEPFSWGFTVTNNGPNPASARLRIAGTSYWICSNDLCGTSTDEEHLLLEGPESCDIELFDSGSLLEGREAVWTCEISDLPEDESETFRIVIQADRRIFGGLAPPSPPTGLLVAVIDQQNPVDPQPVNDAIEVFEYQWVEQTDEPNAQSGDGEGCGGCATTGTDEGGGLVLLAIFSLIGIRLIGRRQHQ
jgi:MYXO-CTERM domain-containing protein